MNKRLVWNFSLDDTAPMDFSRLPQTERDDLRWETRCFWEDNQEIILYGLNDHFLDLSLYDIKRRQDSYYLIPGPYNIKRRHNELLYKPLIQNTKNCQGFAKKINLNNCSREELPQGLEQEIESSAIQVDVEKIALIYKMATQPSLKLELARLIIKNTVYFSACIEGRSKILVQTISQSLFNNHGSEDYVHFLKKAMGIHA